MRDQLTTAPPAVELSGQAKPTSLLRIPLNGRGVVQQLTVPAMFVAANYNRYTFVDETRAISQTSKPAEKRLLVLPGQFDGFHGWMVLTNASGGFSQPRQNQARGVHRRPHPEAA